MVCTGQFSLWRAPVVLLFIILKDFLRAVLPRIHVARGAAYVRVFSIDDDRTALSLNHPQKHSRNYRPSAVIQVPRTPAWSHFSDNFRLG